MGLRMTGESDPRTGYLIRLSTELHARGITSTLIGSGTAPRLHLALERVTGWKDAAFEDNIVTAPGPDGHWHYWWPWLEPIAPATDPATAADRLAFIIRPHDPGDPGEPAGG
jgi:hypothetical protein